MGAALALAVCLSHDGHANGYCLDLGCLFLRWLLPHRGCHGLGSMYVGLQGLPWPWLHARRRVIFLNEVFFFFQYNVFFPLKGGYLGRPACLSLGSVPMGAAFAFASYLWELPWLWQRALAMATIPMHATLILAASPW